MKKSAGIFIWFLLGLSTSVVAQHWKGNSVVIVDPKLPSIDILLKHINPESRVVYLDPGKHPLSSILKILQANAPVKELHILSAGKPGQLVFLDTKVNVSMLHKNEYTLALWKENFSAHADILLYGSEIAKGDEGIGFVRDLAVLTGIDVAASDNLTGSYRQQGDWFLEIKSGRIETQLIVGKKIIEQYPAVLAVGEGNLL